jgi:7,8-dihydropterin-6-yl-methyl-4-(beta-D-ribofuranosyl)aminobenzene 5'-phosphate synthase
VVFNNIPYRQALETAWGFACVIQGLQQTILFDTGSNGQILLRNMDRMGLGPKDIDVLVLSHDHHDHTNGLQAFLEINPKVRVYAPTGLAKRLQGRLGPKTQVFEANAPGKLFASVYTTGSMGQGPEEQALILDLQPGLVIITGCAHPGVVNIVNRAKELLSRKIYLVTGGFHLMGHSRSQVQEIASLLHEQGVEYLAPSHCTGDQAISQLRAAWGPNFLSGGCGARIGINQDQACLLSD